MTQVNDQGGATGGRGSVPELPAAEQKRIIRKVAVRILPVLALAYFINSLDKSNIGLAALRMNTALGLTTTAFGLASGLLFIGYAVFEIPSNLALYRFGARTWMARIMISWGVVAAATSLVQGEASLYVLRILLGIAEAGFYPGVLLYLTFWIPSRYRAQLLALFLFGSGVVGLVGSPLTGLLLTPERYFGIESWRFMFVAEGLPAVVIGVICLFALSDKPSDAKWLTAEERDWLQYSIDGERDTVNARVSGAHSLRMLGSPRVLVLSLIYFCKVFGQYALTFFLPLIIAGFETAAGAKFTPFRVGLISAIPAAVALIPPVLWAAHSDRKQERIWHAAIPLFVAAVGILASVFFAQPLLIMVGVCIATIGTSSQSSAFYQIPPTFLTGVAAAGVFGLVNSLGNLGGFVAPTVFGILRDSTGSFIVPLIVMACVLALGGLLTVLFPRMFKAVVTPTPAADQVATL